MERATLLRMLRENRAFFDQTVALVSDERMREGHWSGKDILAHVTTWERRLLGWLAAAARGASTQIPEPGATWDDMDRLNAVSYAANRDRTLEDITADSRRSFAQVLAQIEAFSDDDLSDPTRFPWLDRQPLWRRIAAGPGYGHYQAHLYDLRYAYHEGGLFTFSRGEDGRVSATEVWTYRFAREPVDASHP